MKLLLVLSLCIMLPGCGTELSREPSHPILRFQSSRTNAVQPVKMISSANLEIGDILLSSSTSVTSLSIRMFSLTGVSHASIYIGENQVAEATGKGVSIISLDRAIDESNNLLALRRPSLSTSQGLSIRDFALAQKGKKYNYKGIVMFAPFMITRRLCELPLLSEGLRDGCLTMLATLQLTDELNDERFFCSQFVVEAYAQAGDPLVRGKANWVSPSDLLHMRTGDVSSWKRLQSMDYVGHIKRWDLAAILNLPTNSD